MSTAPTPALSELLAGAAAAGNDHAGTEKSTGLRHIHNHATGAVVWFPTWRAFRRTEDWAEAVAEQEAVLAKATDDGTSVAEAAAEHLEQQLEILLERAAISADPNAFVEANLVPHLTETWAVADAVARTAGEQLPDGTPPAGFASYPYELYTQDGGVFATTLWNDLLDARRRRALEEEAARKALKPVSRKALKNAARKAARR
jgi:hypothetical protein